MSKLYFFQHTAAGLITKYPFAEPPTEVQRAAVERECFQRFGAEHAKGHKYELWVVEADVLTPDSVIDVPERSLVAVGDTEAKGEASAPITVASGRGYVKNP